MAVTREQLGAVEEPVEVAQVEIGRRSSPGIQRSLDAPFSARQHVPRDDVGVVLHLA